MFAIFTFIKDYSEAGLSTYYLTDEDGFREVSGEKIASHDGLLITHDYWMICEGLHSHAKHLNARVVDLDEFRIFASKRPDLRKEREKVDIIQYINKFSPTQHHTTAKYKKIFYAEEKFDFNTVRDFHQLMQTYYIEICRRAFQNGEFRRFIEVEVPCTSICAKIASRGIPIHPETISEFRADADHQYYKKLKYVSDTFDVPLEIPTLLDIEKYAVSKGVDIDEYSLDFIVNYIPQIREYAQHVLELRELDTTRGILNGIAVRAKRVHPIIDTQGSRTSRISVRSPFLQSLAKRYRGIIAPDNDRSLSYVDFDQFEVGIMAALSRDPALLELYAKSDMYRAFRDEHLGGSGERKAAKILFLAYAYGMKKRHLPLVAASFGVDRDVVKKAFSSFSVYERWKYEAVRCLDRDGFVSTSFGNRFYRKSKVATNKEKLSAISQIVQGEGSLIFKKTLLELSHIDDVEMLLPMHDALLFQHQKPETPERVRAVFESVMSDHFSGEIKGKASIDSFVT